MKSGKIALIAVTVVVLMQLYRPSRTNPPTSTNKTLQSHSQLPPEVSEVLVRSCHDCHSNSTQWPWYSKVAPISWIVVDDVNEGRRHWNMSEWSGYTTRRQLGELDQICREVKGGDMPLVSYTWVHRDTRLSQSERYAVCQWSAAEQQRITAATGVKPPPRENPSNYQPAK